MCNRAYLFVRWIPGVPIGEDLPDEIHTDAEAEEYACRRAAEVHKQACLVLGSGSKIWIDENGDVYHRDAPGETDAPYMEIKGKRFQMMRRAD